MTPERIRIKIAEACGWKRSHTRVGEAQRIQKEWYYICDLPDYPNDLNACHSFEKVIEQKGLTQSYMAGLAHLLGYSVHHSEQWNEIWASLWGCVHATAAQRCEAFLKTLGLWEDGE